MLLCPVCRDRQIQAWWKVELWKQSFENWCCEIKVKQQLKFVSQALEKGHFEIKTAGIKWKGPAVNPVIIKTSRMKSLMKALYDQTSGAAACTADIFAYSHWRAL